MCFFTWRPKSQVLAIMGVSMWAYVFLTIAIIGCVVTALFCRRFVLQAFNSIDVILDRVLTKELSSPDEMTGDDRVSKLSHKAKRVVELCVSEVRRTKKEQETVQGFISDMSHQMKTPLSGISMYLDLMLEGSLSAEDEREFLFRIKAGTDKLKWMMDSLIKMSRLEVGAISLNPAPELICQTISEAIGFVLAAASKKSISINIKEFEDVLLYHDRKWTVEAFVNVLENAVKYSETGGFIEISVEVLPIYTKVVVTDHGIGIEKGDWNNVFKRFYRGENVKESEGVGLGLYLAALIMEKQGGYIMVDSVTGEFTSFSLYLKNGRK